MQQDTTSRLDYTILLMSDLPSYKTTLLKEIGVCDNSPTTLTVSMVSTIGKVSAVYVQESWPIDDGRNKEGGNLQDHNRTEQTLKI